MKKIKHQNRNKKTSANLKESKKFITFGIVFGAILLAVCIAVVYVLTN